MTHTGPMSDSEGDFGVWKPIVMADFKCRKCSGHNINYRSWDSSCGGYEDQQFKCLDCNHTWWVEGPDA